MARILPKSVFYHIPKTGGTWVNHVLKQMFIKTREYKEERHRSPVLNLRLEHISPLHADKKVVGDRISFAFVRNPVTWYQSFWKYKDKSRWDEPHARYSDTSFNGFMKKIMNISPGFLTDTYKEFKDVDFMGKQENLKEDLLTFLIATGEDVRRSDLIEKTPPMNTTPNSKCLYDPEVLEDMKELEKWIFKKYYPEEL